MPEPNLLEHVKDDTLWKAVGAVFGALWLGFLGLVKVLYRRDQAKFETLFEWKDKTVDPAFREMPEKYVLTKACDRKHDELLAEIRDSRQEQRDEARHLRRLLEAHLKINGNGNGP